MIGNIVIFAVALCLICYVVKVFGSDLRSKTAFHLSAIIAALILLFSIIVPNIDFVKSPFTPEIHGKVVDAITNQPISGATVIIDWGYSYGEFPMHSSGASLKQLIITTDASGKFKVDRRLRCLAINLFPLYLRDSGGVGIMVLHRDYKNKVIREYMRETELVIMTKYSTTDEIVTDNNNMRAIADIESRRGLNKTADAIRRVVAEKDERIKAYYGYKER